MFVDPVVRLIRRQSEPPTLRVTPYFAHITPPVVQLPLAAMLAYNHLSPPRIAWLEYRKRCSLLTS